MFLREKRDLQVLAVACAIGILILLGQSASEAQTSRPNGQPLAKPVGQQTKETKLENWWEAAPLVDASSAPPSTQVNSGEAAQKKLNSLADTLDPESNQPLAPPVKPSSLLDRRSGVEVNSEHVREQAAEYTEYAGAVIPLFGGVKVKAENTRAQVPFDPSTASLVDGVEVNTEKTQARDMLDAGGTGTVVAWVLLIAGLTGYLVVRRDEKLVLLVFAFVAVGMMLYPPFHVVRSGTEMNMGYGFLFDPPKLGNQVASVNVAVLLAQWVVTILVSAVGWVLTRNNAKQDKEVSDPATVVVVRERNPESKTLVETASFLLLRLLRTLVGLVFGWQVVGLLPVATWVANPSAITVEMVTMVVLKIALMAVAGMTFFGFRKCIHWLHKRWYGIPHPALSKAMAL